MPRKQITAGKIDEAMEAAKCDKGLAAEILGITKAQLRNRITADETLKMKYTKHGLTIQRQLGIINSNRSVAERNINAAHTTLDLNSKRILKQLDALEDRIKRGEDADFLTDEQFTAKYKDITLRQRYAFKDNINGDPKEETMVREAYMKLHEYFIKVTDTFVKAMEASAKVEAIVKGKEDESAKLGAQRRTPGFGPKRAPVLRAPPPGTQVLAQAGSEVHLHTNGKGEA